MGDHTSAWAAAASAQVVCLRNQKEEGDRTSAWAAEASDQAVLEDPYTSAWAVAAGA